MLNSIFPSPWLVSPPLTFPAYPPLRRTIKPSTVIITTWPKGASSQLQGCFEQTEWDLLDEDIWKNTSNLCKKHHHWKTHLGVSQPSHVQTLLSKRNTTFMLGDKARYSTARANLKRRIKAATETYKQGIKNILTHNNPRRICKVIQHITNYKSSTNRTGNAECSLAEELYHFFARFETNKPAAVMLTLPSTNTQTHSAGTGRTVCATGS